MSLFVQPQRVNANAPWSVLFVLNLAFKFFAMFLCDAHAQTFFCAYHWRIQSFEHAQNFQFGYIKAVKN